MSKSRIVALMPCVALSAGLLRAGEFAQYDGFLPKGEAAVVWQGADIGEIKALRATMNGAWIGADCKAHAVIYDRTPTSFTAQFQTIHGNYLKYTRYFFRQEGADIVAYGDASGYTSATGDYGLVKTSFGLQVSSAKDNGAYGAYGVEVAQTTVGTAEAYAALPAELALDRELVEFAVPDGGVTVTNAIAGEGEVWVSGAGVVAGSLEGFLTTEWRTVLTNANVHDVEVTGGTMCGNWVPGAPYEVSVQHIVRTSASVGMQLQVRASDGWLKVVGITLAQQGEAVAVKADWARYDSGEVGADLSASYRGTAAIAVSETGNGYGIRDFAFAYRPHLALSGGKSWAWGKSPMVIDNASVELRNSPLPANATAVLRNGGVLTLAVAGGSYQGGDSRTYDIGPGSVLRLNQWMALASGAKVVVDGGTLDEINLSSDYLNDCVVTNGGKLVGRALRVGYAADANLRFEGPLPISLPTGFIAYNKSDTMIRFDVRVATEITGDLSSDASYTGATLVKQGAETLTWWRNLNVGPVRVEAGTLRLAADDSLVADRGQDVTLAGGTLATAAEVSAGTLTLAGDATIDVTAGTLAFAASAANGWSEGARLTVTGSDFFRRSRRLRFGTDAGGLAGAQLAAIRFAGLGGDFAARLDGEGYLYASRGLVITIR
ncbi:MAG: hypothetical protein ACI4RD_02375 [Kiritimatiellia bacterium]